MSFRVLHLLRPAQGGMLTQVRSLLNENCLLAAPPAVLFALADCPVAGVYPLPESDGVKHQLRGGMTVGRWAQREGATLLHGHGLRRAPLYALASLCSRLPLVMTLHNLVPAHLSLAIRTVLRRALGVCKRVICVSQAVADSAKPLVPPERLRVVPNGLDVAKFRVSTGGDGVLCVARLSPEKDLTTLLEAVALVPELRLRIAGEGAERPRLEAVMQTLCLTERVTLLGQRGDVAELLETADLFCLPSREEGFGLAALEALAAGVPVVATEVGGLPSFVRSEENGLLVPVGNPALLANALRRLWEDPALRQRWGASGRRFVTENFSLITLRTRTESVYQEALAR